ncbi:MAG: hypothetical protein H6811_11800 [Phycisphaeraceae bacterium]|nr:hypothetical protein [Phycisphaeraceae bacterium]
MTGMRVRTAGLVVAVGSAWCAGVDIEVVDPPRVSVGAELVLPLGTSITDVRAVEVGGSERLLVAFSGELLHVRLTDESEEPFVVESRRVIAREHSRLRFTDLTGDGSDEIVACGTPGLSSIIAYSLTGEVLWETRVGFPNASTALFVPRHWPEPGGHNVFVANSSTGDCALLDGDGRVLWRHTLGSMSAEGASVCADIDDDGIPEIVAALGDEIAVLTQAGDLMRIPCDPAHTSRSSWVWGGPWIYRVEGSLHAPAGILLSVSVPRREGHVYCRIKLSRDEEGRARCEWSRVEGERLIVESGKLSEVVLVKWERRLGLCPLTIDLPEDGSGLRGRRLRVFGVDLTAEEVVFTRDFQTPAHGWRSWYYGGVSRLASRPDAAIVWWGRSVWLLELE